MIDTCTFVLHSINEKMIDLKPGTQRGLVYTNDFNRVLYERLCEYESDYIERTKDFLNEHELINPDDTYFKSEAVKKVGYVSRRGAIIETKDKGEFFFRPVRGNIITASSEYRTKFSVSENYDAITFELSIPKYLYNHNVAQFVPNIDSKRYKDNPIGFRDWYSQIKNIHTRLMEFIYTFFDDLGLFLNLPSIKDFDISLIEIKRLDLCYNQIFPSHEMVLDYLITQKKFLNTRTRKDTIVKDEYDSSFSYRHSTDGFYFKIYAKGDEFEKNDAPRLFKENRQHFDKNSDKLMPLFKDVFQKHFEKTYSNNNGRIEDLIFAYYKQYLTSTEHQGYCRDLEQYLPFKTSFLLSESKKILRYEMSFTRTYMSTLYKREIFRKHCVLWKRMLKAYNLIKRYDLLLSQGNKNKAKKFKSDYRLTDIERNYHNLINQSLHKKHQFRIKTNDKHKLHESKTDNIDYTKIQTYKNYRLPELPTATLSVDMMQLIYKKFKDEIEFFQLKEFKDTKSVLELIDDYNTKAEDNIKSYKKMFGEADFKKLTHTQKRNKKLSKLNKTRLKVVIDRMDGGESVKTIADNMGMSKSAYHTLLNDLKLFDLHKQTVKHKFNYHLIRTDWKPYYDKFYIESNYHRKLFSNPFMVSFDTIRQNF